MTEKQTFKIIAFLWVVLLCNLASNCNDDQARMRRAYARCAQVVGSEVLGKAYGESKTNTFYRSQEYAIIASGCEVPDE